MYYRKYAEHFDNVLAFRPTGWTFKETSEPDDLSLSVISASSDGKMVILGVPYSEHSSFAELERFVTTLQPNKVIPTVNVGSAENRREMETWFAKWWKPRIT
jgi:DNA cross-link repair 1A protein